MSDAIQSLCELGQTALLATDYHAAERYLNAAEVLAFKSKDYDALARLYMPLQETHRQRRQLCGDGPFVTQFARTPDDTIHVTELAERYQRGQFIVAGYRSITPSVLLRALAQSRGLFLDVPLAATYVLEEAPVLLIVPSPEVTLPPPERATTIDGLLRHAPPQSIVIPIDALPPNTARPDASAFGYVMGLWEALHAPFLAMGDGATDPLQKIIAYRQAIRVDYACEFAHQRLSEAARTLHRGL